jgi:hypothetical protein
MASRCLSMLRLEYLHEEEECPVRHSIVAASRNAVPESLETVRYFVVVVPSTAKTSSVSSLVHHVGASRRSHGANRAKLWLNPCPLGTRRLSAGLDIYRRVKKGSPTTQRDCDFESFGWALILWLNITSPTRRDHNAHSVKAYVSGNSGD